MLYSSPICYIQCVAVRTVTNISDMYGLFQYMITVSGFHPSDREAHEYIPLQDTAGRATSAGYTTNIITAVKEDHSRIQTLWDQFNNVVDRASKQQLADSIIEAVSKHDACEMTFLYTLLRRYGADRGNRYADESESDHDRIRWALYKLDQSNIDQPGKSVHHKTIARHFSYLCYVVIRSSLNGSKTYTTAPCMFEIFT